MSQQQRDWGATSDTTTIPDVPFTGETVTFKNQITVAERKRIQTAALGRVVEGTDEEEGGVALNWAYSIVRVATWLASWTRKDDKGRAIPINRQAVEALHEDVFNTIETALNAHIATMNPKTAEEQGKVPEGEANPTQPATP